jgi:hypothetical protein
VRSGIRVVLSRFVPVKQLPRTAHGEEDQRRRKQATEIKMQSAQETHPRKYELRRQN